ncbi:hypothetical protein AAF712_012267 [Marasmius tenuissimus]|uniref:Uncharacterized protein n=1 Tax=Marasmius tenuissimus TaxID=585030 RepID=A0ABR2ZIX6_9AGAR
MRTRFVVASLLLLTPDVINARGRETVATSVTIQRFVPNALATENFVYQVTQAMSDFKERNVDEVDEVFVGVIPGNPTLVEQIFVWKALSSDIPNVIEPFLVFSDSARMNISATGVLDDPEYSLNEALYAPTTETVIQELRPGFDRAELKKAFSFLSASIRDTEGGYGSTIGLGSDGTSTVRLVFNGWGTREAASQWVSNQNGTTKAMFDKVKENGVGNLRQAFKPIVEVV